MPLDYNADHGPHPRRRRGKIILAPILLAILLIAMQYLGAPQFTSPETGRSVRVALSPQEEQVLGLQSFQQVLAESRVVESGPQAEMVRAVVRRLIPGVDAEARQFKWAAALLESRQANAFCLPGGKIAVYSGILPVTRNEAGLAAVLGHEIAHATLRHGAQRMFKERIVQTALQGFSGSLMDYDAGQRHQIMAVLGAGVQYGLILPYGRDHELEADEVGLRYMMRAGYDPEEAIHFWERMGQAGGDQPPEWASTHPSHGSRIERLRKIIGENRERRSY